MKTLAKVLGVFILLIVVLIVAAPFFIPKDAIIEQVQDQVQKTTGRTLAIAGETELAVFPSLAIELNQVSLSNMASGSQAEMISMEQLAIHVPWLSLLNSELTIDTFVMSKPTIFLETDQQGKANWQLFPQAPTAEKSSTPSGSVTLPEGFDAKLGEVAIYDGSLTFLDGVTGQSQQVTGINMAIGLASLYQPLTLKGDVTYQGQTFSLTAQIDHLADAIEGNTFSTEVTLDNELVSLDYQGTVAELGKVIDGALELDVPSVKSLTAWQNIQLGAKDNAFNAMNLATKIGLNGNTASLSDLVLTFDELAVKGQASLIMASPLKVAANVDLGMLDINPYLPEPVEATPQPESEEKAKPIVWDDTAIDLSGLKTLNADVTIAATGFKVRDITLGTTAMNARLNAGTLDLTLSEFNAYQGSGNGKVTLNGAAKPYQVSTDFTLTGIDAEPLLTDAVGFNKLMGTGNLNLALTTQGQSQKEFVNALAGELGFNFKDGAVKGANIAALIRSAKSALKGDFKQAGLDTSFDESEKTDFSALTGTFQISNGVARNQDLNLASPLLRLTGEGTVDLPKTYLDYGLKPKLVATIQGQGGNEDAKGLSIPVRLKGPFHDAKVKLDVGDAAKERAKDKLKEKAKDKLKSLFGGI